MSKKSDLKNNLLRALPSIDRILLLPAIQPLLQRYNREYVLGCCRDLLDDLRAAARAGKAILPEELSEGSILKRLAARLSADSIPELTQVVNATGTILHTNLGRALLPQAALAALAQVAQHPVNLEYDLATGKRGKREENVERLLRQLTGAEAASVVNNNAAAVLLGLNTVAQGKEVIVSRGELIEIGGSFRIPEVMAKSGAILKEVGSTNRTHPADYERAIGEKTALLLKVHTSNYKIVGFVAEVRLDQLVAIGQKHKIPVMEDLGSGALLDLSEHGLPKEPVVAEQMSAGADIVTFSGDKVLGGPQAGLVVGKKQWLDQMNKNPLKRALRCGKLTLAALEATLKIYQQSPDAVAEVPTLRAFTRPLREIEQMGQQVLPLLQKSLGEEFALTLEDSAAQIGSGALPMEEIPSKVIAIHHATLGAEKIAQRFRMAKPPILGRVRENRFLLDLRLVFNPEELIPHF